MGKMSMFPHRRRYNGYVYTLSSIDTKSVAKVLAKQMRATGRSVRLVTKASIPGKVALYSRWQRG